MENVPVPDKQLFMDLVSSQMPFGKYKGWLICDLPEPYLVWFREKGFPEGKLGILLASMYEIKLNKVNLKLETGAPLKLRLD